MNWKKHSLSTHITGVDYVKSPKMREFFLDKILECFGDECGCPISSNDTFSDGVYFHKEMGCFAKFENRWYKYNHSEMFEYYQVQLDVSEIDTKEQNIIYEFGKTKYATKDQREMADHIAGLKSQRKTKIEMFKRFIDHHHRIKKMKQRKKK